ncbi:hypothetical protein RRG08_010466 [Elysia crispata]|uniref:Uncharacterized protein n=1 Tax=Elysia crispata TaxID=231223 RepID=A0AAE1ANG7_9GAST|nr:hypothetical protein RRG08_010466 [Elysia crispata]
MRVDFQFRRRPSTRLETKGVERFADACVIPHNRFGGGSLHVWAGISYHYKTQLHIFRNNVDTQTHINDILRLIVVPLSTVNNDD